MRQDVRLAGFGGQGIVLAGYLLGKAAAVHAGREAVLTQSYGPEARGGACAAQIAIDDEPIEFPHFEEADCLVVLSQEAFDTYGPTAKPGAVLIVDADLVTRAPGNAHRVPFTRAAEELGARIVANVVMLGCLVALTRIGGPREESWIVPREAMEEAIRTHVRPRVVELNLAAFAHGFELGQRAEVTA